MHYSGGLPFYLVLQVPPDLALQPPHYLIQVPEGGPIDGIGVGRRSHDGARVLVNVSPRHPARLLAEDDEALYRMAEEAVPRYYPALKGCPVIARRLVRWRCKVPTWRPGYLAQLRQARPHLAQPPLYLCGDYLAGPSAGAALFSGWECAAAVRRALEA